MTDSDSNLSNESKGDEKKDITVDTIGNGVDLDRINKILVAVNGDLFVANDSGEADELIEKNITLFPAKWPKGVQEGKASGATADNIAEFVGLNWHYLTGVITDVTLRAKVVYARLLAARHGLTHPDFDRSKNHVKYNDSKFASAKTLNDANVAKSFEEFSKAVDAIPEEQRNGLQHQFNNLVAIVAIMFRSRGHHYLDEMADRYEALWAKNRNAPKDLYRKSDWAHLATTALHAIFPQVLDAYLLACVNNGTVCNPFILRAEGPCAGTAVWYATFAGVANVQTITGTKNKLLLAQIAILQTVMEKLRRNRWMGGINRNFYGAPALQEDPKSVQELIAAVRGMVDPVEIQSTLKESKALSRAAKQAPIVGAVWAALSNAIIESASSAEIRKPLGFKALTAVGFGDEVSSPNAPNT